MLHAKSSEKHTWEQRVWVRGGRTDVLLAFYVCFGLWPRRLVEMQMEVGEGGIRSRLSAMNAAVGYDRLVKP